MIAIVIWLILIFIIASVCNPGFLTMFFISFFSILIIGLLVNWIKESFKNKKFEAQLRQMEIEDREWETARNQLKINRDQVTEDAALNYCNAYGLQFVSLNDNELTTIDSDNNKMTAKVAFDNKGNIIFKNLIRIEKL